MSVTGFGDITVMFNLSSSDHRYWSIRYTAGVRFSIFTNLLQQSITCN